MTSLSSSGSRASDSAVEPTRSQNSTVRRRRSATCTGACARRVPHSLQNLLAGGLIVPHWSQRTGLTPAVFPNRCFQSTESGRVIASAVSTPRLRYDRSRGVAARKRQPDRSDPAGLCLGRAVAVDALLVLALVVFDALRQAAEQDLIREGALEHAVELARAGAVAALDTGPQIRARHLTGMSRAPLLGAGVLRAVDVV